MDVGFITHTGQRKQNQDNALIDQDIGLYAVADGVGGGDSGEIASASVCMSLRQKLLAGVGLVDAISGAHQILLSQPIAGASGYAASTIVAVEQDKHQMKLAWVGDSRIYLLRAGNLYQLSEDHSVVQQVQGLSEREMQRMRHVLTQAVGVAGEDGLIVDTCNVNRFPGDSWLLCSDGLHGVLSGETIRELLGSSAAAQDIAARLLQMALDNDADDNVTLVVMKESQHYEVPPELAENTLVPPGRPAAVAPVAPPERQASDAAESPDPGDQRQSPWHYILLGGLLAALLFFALFWGF